MLGLQLYGALHPSQPPRAALCQLHLPLSQQPEGPLRQQPFPQQRPVAAAKQRQTASQQQELLEVGELWPWVLAPPLQTPEALGQAAPQPVQPPESPWQTAPQPGLALPLQPVEMQ